MALRAASRSFPFLLLWSCVRGDWGEGLRDKPRVLHARPALQPEELTNALEISNIVFTSLFALEMLLKLLVYGPFGYIKNPYNIFDGVIVVISVWEIVGQQGGGLSVLRTFRLMRVLKLVRFLPALQRQLVVLMKTMDNVATFCMLLMLFIFIFSILGMHLFGCKFASERDGDTLPDRKNFDSLLWAIVTVFQILTQEDWNKVLYNGMASTSSWAALYFIALMTFGNYVLFNLLVAILVEGFQAEEISKREDASGQLSCIQLPVDSQGGDATKSESEPDFFSPSLDGDGDRKKRLALVSLGEHPELRRSLLPPLIIHTAATPMSLPKSSSTGLAEALGPASRRTSSSGSAEPGAAHEMKSPPSARSSPHSPWSAASSWASRRSSRNSLGRAPSLKRRSPSGERRSLLSGEGQESQDEEESSEEERASPAGSDRRHRGSLEPEAKSSFDLPDTLQVPGCTAQPAAAAPPPSTRAAMASQPRGAWPVPCTPTTPRWMEMMAMTRATWDQDLPVSNSKGERMRAWIRARLPACCRERDTWSAYIFPPQSRFRLLCHRIITHKMFDHVVLVIIFLNCITIAMERPKIRPAQRSPTWPKEGPRWATPACSLLQERIFLTLSNYVFTAVFLAEMTVKVVALGWCFGEQAYLRSSWNVLDGLLVLISIIDILVSMVSDSGTKILGMLRVLRLLRTLRPLRVISRAQGLKLVVETLMSSLKPIGNIVVICCAFFIIFGILGVQLVPPLFQRAISRLLSPGPRASGLFAAWALCRKLEAWKRAPEGARASERLLTCDSCRLPSRPLRALHLERRCWHRPTVCSGIPSLPSLLEWGGLQARPGDPGPRQLGQDARRAVRPQGCWERWGWEFWESGGHSSLLPVSGYPCAQLFKGKFFVCQGEDTRNITNKSDCAEASYRWVRHKYNFDNLGQALMSLFVLASKDGWVDIMYDGLDAVGVDQQPIMNHNPWMLLYFISFLLIVAFFVLNMFVGVVVENFHKCRQHQEEEEARRREEKRLRRLEKKRRSKEKQMADLMLDDVIASGSSASAAPEAQCKPYYSDYSRFRLLVHNFCTSHYLDLFITGVIGLNVVTMAMEHYQQPQIWEVQRAGGQQVSSMALSIMHHPCQILDEALKICNYIFTIIFVLESVFKLVAFGFRRFFQDRWNQLDLAIVLLSIMGITLEEIEVNASLPINPTIIRIMRVLRIARGQWPAACPPHSPSLGDRPGGIAGVGSGAGQGLGRCGFLWVFLRQRGRWGWAEGGSGAMAAWLAEARHPTRPGPGRGPTSYVTWDSEGPAHDFVLSAVLKLLKMAVGMRALLDTVMQALPQVGNLGLLFMLLFFIFAALGVELFGDLECDETHPCEGLGRHATFRNFGMAFLTLFRVSTGDNWNGIMKDTLRDCDQESTCYNTVISPIYFVSFVLTAQFVLVNVVIAVLMKHLEESNKEAKEEAELEAELELEMKPLSPQPHSPLGSPFLWPGVEGPDSPKPGAPHAVTHAGAASSRYSLEHPTDRQMFDTISLLIQGSLEGELKLMDELAGPEGQPSAFPPASSPGGSDPQRGPHPGEVPDLLTVRKSGVSRTHSLPNDSYMCRDGSTAEGSLGHRSWGLPKAQSGSVLSVHSQPADTSYILQLPKDAPQLLQPHGAPTWGAIPKLPPPGRSPLAQRPLRRQVSRPRAVGMGPRANLSVGTPRLLVMTRAASSVLPANPDWEPVTGQPRHQDKAEAVCALQETHLGPKPTGDQTQLRAGHGAELGFRRPPAGGGQEAPPSPRDLKKCYSVEAQSCGRRPASWLEEQRRHSIAVSCLDSATQPHLDPGPSGLGGNLWGGLGAGPRKNSVRPVSL
ncbi:hypothetical protein QTO34_009004 [Cnephaeus nilssonii]|uniref:Ion transport domain-containing protein n=1 Tax=Cnephaeus nilssonii TaxID=3371016 RepID=A0AA40HI10_CNENI|nr:hypothetical protein QTO34_009004 [Eptesicus nilssonii]